MDISSTFKAEIFRPVATVLIPGLVAIFPYVLLVMHAVPLLASFWDTHEATFLSVVVLTSIAVGLVLEDIGSRIEIAWDRVIARRHNEDITTEWYAYLRLSPSPEQIGHHYLGTVTLRLKFELAFSLSLMVFWPGLIWLNAVSAFMSSGVVLALTPLVIVLIIYLLVESHGSSKLLSDLRKELLPGK